MAMLALSLPTPARADFEQNKRRCVGDTNLDIKIGGCTWLIQSGRLNNFNLAKLFTTAALPTIKNANTAKCSGTKKRQSASGPITPPPNMP